MVNTLVNDWFVHKGSQSVLFVRSVVYGPLQTLGNASFVHMGLCIAPRIISLDTYS